MQHSTTCIKRRSAGIRKQHDIYIAYADRDTSKETKIEIMERIPEAPRTFIEAIVKSMGRLNQLEVRWRNETDTL